ncbi:Rieske (2Fe-2S) protein [Streptomyces massasporeus]|uniref:Rieske (2Fe-2S) protein n=1 Tax=Streptomyces massasporeus TaxID=67324 RepID=UPI0034027074
MRKDAPGMQYVVGTVAEFEERRAKIVRLGNRTVGVFRINDEYYALRNYCPHQGAPLCAGKVLPDLSAQDGSQIDVDEGTWFVACPWHGWEYDIRTGQSYFGANHPPARGYHVSVTAQASPPEIPGRAPGPYVADSYEVRVQDRYVVVDTSRRPD